MTTIPDEALLACSQSANGQVVLITGGAKGIGRETALLFGKHGARVVIGDIDAKGCQDVVDLITGAGGEAIFQPCNVTKWDDLVSLFEKAVERFGSVDSVIPVAGVANEEAFEQLKEQSGRPVKPNLTTVEINLTAAIHTSYLAMHYLKKTKANNRLKSIVLMASMSSWQAIPGVPLYSASKHGLLGFMRALAPMAQTEGIHIASVHPFFVDTGLVPTVMKAVLAGVPLTPVTRVASTVFYAATNPDWAIHGSTLVLLDDGPVLRLEKENLREGVYGIMNKRAARVQGRL
ncbi:NAD P-binding protein [Gloeophyllum trabeum ATCC 11539]|uniref:NAD P-binding protein n=1 Tax=Gloeophyllum trabeum (strain ATCC 11539 / FP-39264 / Madison 617) TaxID=670483 RepID=S7RV43_GLOTA|nr:NAD P-binding protein [Gloeophyllum trabeum ATCC 11539]EPQ57089.1 NAD P-binding protein [Gloeophyllum trabeum ATCC 11539]